jgi:RNA polymerase sigma-70 factor (ECF subfamily)
MLADSDASRDRGTTPAPRPPEPPAETTPTPGSVPDGWLERFHAGDRPVLEQIYQQHFLRVDGAVGSVLAGADRETVVHELFLRLLRDPAFRRCFRGGNLSAWLSTVARNQAIDYSRRRNREAPAGVRLGERLSSGDELARSTEARLLIERFVRDVLPPAWRDVFQARFIEQLSQAQAAAAVGKRRTTLAYQELRIRRMLRTFLLAE